MCVGLLVMLMLLMGLVLPARSQQRISSSEVGSAGDVASAGEAVLSTDAVGSTHFVAVHGRRAVVMGYPAKGLEIWGYPFQILSDYQIGFRTQGSTAEADARTLLRSVRYERDAVTRTYVGADYLVREKIFVPLDDAAAAIEYEIEGTRAVDVVVHFQPVLDLMWPGAVGGQYTRWLESGPGYQITEPEHGISAVVGSAEAVAHDDTLNSTIHAEMKLSFTIRPTAAGHPIAAGHPPAAGHPTAGRPGVSRATLYVVLNAAHAVDPAAAMHEMRKRMGEKEAEVKAHYVALEHASLRLHTPDEAVNSAVAWAENALDQAWVCNPKLGCGMVAGYGPSRDARRPQYAWYFAGDGLIATEALISAGEYGRAKEELEFIAKYQEPATGMIWHELSQSAGYIDWSKYPYMYVHVDISFDYLTTAARYVASSGDRAFAIDHWPSLEKAYRYCRSIVRDADHLPHIPSDKEGGDEQARPGDDLGLSAAWLAASAGFEELARMNGHPQLAAEAHLQNQLTRDAIPTHYWDQQQHFWIDGHTQAGVPIASRRRGPSTLIEQHVFTEQQGGTLLDQLAGADFQTDWGLREVAASSPDYDPYSYGRGSVTAPSTTGAAVTFWKEHRPAIGNAIWREVLQWNTLDAPGHIHEVLAGNFYHEQAESVPEQMWSSAGLLDATVRGMLGLEVYGGRNLVGLAPHLPPEWDRVSVEHVRLPASMLGLVLRQSMHDVDLEIRNEGKATKLLFEPEIPLGAQLLEARLEGRVVPAETEIFAEDEHAKLSLEIPPGVSHCHLEFKGGVTLIVPAHELHVGDASTGVKLTNVQLQGRTLVLEADVHAQTKATFLLRTPWKMMAHEGADAVAVSDTLYEITVDGSAAATGYAHARAKLQFAAE